MKKTPLKMSLLLLISIMVSTTQAKEKKDKINDMKTLEKVDGIKLTEITYQVKVDANGDTILYQVTNYLLKPGFLTGMMKGKLKKGSRETLILYKHLIETGEKNADKETVLKMKKYKDV